MKLPLFLACLLAAASSTTALPATAVVDTAIEDVSTESHGDSCKVPHFKHPGVLVSAAQLKVIKHGVSKGKEPWASAYSAMLAHPLASMTRQPKPFATVECGPTSTPNIGCYEERGDALAAYAFSLAWVASGVQAYADKAIAYMNAWSHTLKAHTNSNAPLQTGWAGAVWPRAAEIMRYSGGGWATADIKAMEDMLRNVYLPKVSGGAANINGNWELVMMEAAIGISVFISNRTSYDLAMAKFLDRVPAYIYLLSDGPLPHVAAEDNHPTPEAIKSYWNNLSQFTLDGLSQETCRDLNHTGYGFESIAHVAETSRIQGRDLYREDTGTRLQKGFELHAGFENNPSSIPSWLCGGKLAWNLGPTTEVAYNALANRLHRNLPNLLKVTLKNRPAAYGTNLPLFYAWETLSHADNPK